ncbi:efflux RND transporter permease subunit [Xanthomonas fragariae]|nr:efflux RND transporter permease subunit [Xanthomonas fragariae]AOD15993.1 hypothetical protein BER92_16475 [Xanthomonas fragariae]AOD19418.1 hypothetical protein BER93_16525 [Xanthomonas fragariae]
MLAITRNSKGQAVAMVVGAGGKVAQRMVTTGDAVGARWVVSEGLSAGERVIVQDLQKIQVGMPVKTREVTVAAIAPAAIAPNAVPVTAAPASTAPKVSQGEALLSDDVKTNGLTVTKSDSGSMFMVLAFTSEDSSMDSTDIGDYMVSALQDLISRLNGIGSVNVFGAEYAIRVWLDPEKLHTYALKPSDVSTAIAAQNADVSSDALDALSALQGQQLDAMVTSRSKLSTPAQFENIVLKSDASGATVYLRDVARLELGSESYGPSSRFNSKPFAGMGLQLATGANALDAAKPVEAKLDALTPYFPAGLTYQMA